MKNVPYIDNGGFYYYDLPKILNYFFHIGQLDPVPDWLADWMQNEWDRDFPLDFTNWIVQQRINLHDPVIWQDQAILWYETKRMGTELFVPNPSEQMNHCKTLDDLHILSEQWHKTNSTATFKQRVRAFVKKYGSDSFPAPLFTGTPEIMPINTIYHLLLEEQEFNNFIGSQADSIMQRRCYYYRVLKPERSTLKISHYHPYFKPAWLKTAYGGVPSDVTYTLVADWIEEELFDQEL